jgi:[ribosomal protein S5]-alanine N-acetyltransferase
MELILKAKDIRVEFKGRDVLDINELEVYDYDRIGLVGANGAGKSTLLRVLLGELTPPGCKMNRLGELAYMANTPKDMLRYAVCLKENDFIIGDVFALREYTDTFSVGWHFNQCFEGKGLAYEATTEFLDYLFRDACARRVYGFVEDDNLRSKRLCKRLGMRYEGCMKEFISFVCDPDGAPRYEDTCIYAILKKEWTCEKQMDGHNGKKQ